MSEPEVFLEDVSKFYGEILGVNRVSLRIPPGVTSIVGPNGSGKTTLMNLIAGLIRPDRGRISVRGLEPSDPERLMRILGYATQYDTAPRWTTGLEFVSCWLELHGYSSEAARRKAWEAIVKVGLEEAALRKVTSYSKGMRQRIRLAQAIAHDPEVLVLDEPLNGLDPVARAETVSLFKEMAGRGCHVILSSHVLQEVDAISDQVVLLANGSVVAEGKIRSVREEIREQPRQFLVACSDPGKLARYLFRFDHVTEVRLNESRTGLLVKTHRPDVLARELTQVALDGLYVETVVPVDENVDALYQYIIGGERT